MKTTITPDILVDKKQASEADMKAGFATQAQVDAAKALTQWRKDNPGKKADTAMEEAGQIRRLTIRFNEVNAKKIVKSLGTASKAINEAKIFPGLQGGIAKAELQVAAHLNQEIEDNAKGKGEVKFQAGELAYFNKVSGKAAPNVIPLDKLSVEDVEAQVS